MASPKWRFCSSIYQGRKHFTVYRDEHLGVQLEIKVRRYWQFTRPREKFSYYIDGVNRIFTLEAKLMRALNIISVRRRILRLQTAKRVQPAVTHGVVGKLNARASMG